MKSKIIQKERFIIRGLWLFTLLLFAQSSSAMVEIPNPSMPEKGVLSRQTKIYGTVVGDNGSPLEGVSVHLKNDPLSNAITDANGYFSFELKTASDTLIIQSIGFAQQKILVTADMPLPLKITLKQKINELNDVVIIGYGSSRKKDLTGAISVVDGKDIANRNETQLSTVLQGLVPGMSVTRNSSIPGSNTATLRVRGITTIGNSNPLILVDGIAVEDINRINPNDVESISVLKDASAASIYGARAAAGVILITTKQPENNQVSLEYTGTVGAVTPTRLPEPVNYKRYMEMINEVAWNDGGNVSGGEYPVYGKDFIADYGWNNKFNPDQYPITNWQDVLLKESALFTDHNLSLNYGNDIVKLNTSLNYDYTGGLYKSKSTERASVRINAGIKFNKFISIHINTYYLNNLDNSPVNNPFVTAYKYGPLAIPYWSDGTTAPGRFGTNMWARLNYGGFIDNQKSQFYGRFAFELRPVKNLKITGVYAPSLYKTKVKSFTRQVPYYDIDDRTQPAGFINGNLTNNLSESRPDTKRLTKQLYANYQININLKHHLSLLAGYEDEYRMAETLTAGSDQLALSEFPYLDRANLDFLQTSGDANETAYRSFFGRLNYEFDNKYLLQANIRYDGSSRFAKEHRWGVFPSVSAGWVLTEEKFIKQLDWKSLSFFKIRGSWGKLGNERIGNYPYQSIMGFHDVLFFDGGKISSATSASQTDYNVNDITWETTTTWNIGIDATLFNNRLSVTADYYKKETKNMLLQLAIPRFMGYGLPYQNAGYMHTKGWEFSLGWKDQIGQFRYAVNAHLSDYKSVMGDLSGIVFMGDQIIREGSEYNEWYGYRSSGLFQTQNEVDTDPLLSGTEKPGDVKYVDVSGPDGTPDGVISPTYDKVLLGSSLPRYEYGGTINLGYRNFDLSIMFQGVGKQLSRLTDDMTYQTTAWYTFPKFIDGGYYSAYNTEEQNKRASFPRLSQIGFDGNNYSLSDFWLFDGSYFRLKNLSLGYTLPEQLLRHLDVANVRIFATVSDLFSLDHYPRGWDPEAALSAYIARTWTGGISITF